MSLFNPEPTEPIETEPVESDENFSRCIGCRIPIAGDDWACDECEKRYPPSLLKAAGDYFDYALRLMTGEVVFFNDATIRGDWAHLEMGDYWHAGEDIAVPRLAIPAKRGLDVRVDQIVWCADAPFGS